MCQVLAHRYPRRLLINDRTSPLCGKSQFWLTKSCIGIWLPTQATNIKAASASFGPLPLGLMILIVKRIDILRYRSSPPRATTEFIETLAFALGFLLLWLCDRMLSN